MTLYTSKAEMAGDAIYAAFKKAGIGVVLNYYPSGENECIVDTTEHDKEVIRKFAEWIEQHFNDESCLYSDCEGRDCFDAEKALAKYEKQMKGEQT